MLENVKYTVYWLHLRIKLCLIASTERPSARRDFKQYSLFSLNEASVG